MRIAGPLDDADEPLPVRAEDQGMGLGTEMLRILLQIACDEGQERVVAEIMPENSGMRRVCTKLGFEFERIPESPNYKAEIEL